MIRVMNSQVRGGESGRGIFVRGALVEPCALLAGRGWSFFFGEWSPANHRANEVDRKWTGSGPLGYHFGPLLDRSHFGPLRSTSVALQCHPSWPGPPRAKNLSLDAHKVSNLLENIPYLVTGDR